MHPMIVTYRFTQRQLFTWLLLLGCLLAPITTSAADRVPNDHEIDQVAFNQMLDALAESPPPAVDGSNHVQTANTFAPITVPDLNAVDKPAAAPVGTEPLSPLEQQYSQRAGGTLRQYGYELFKQISANAHAAGGVAQDYILGLNDRVQVALRGQRNSTEIYKVDSEGRLLINDLPPIQAAGRPLGQVSQEIDSAVQSRLLDTQAYVSMAQLRQLNVQVLGEVGKPGRQSLPALSSVVDALTQAGGVSKTGSLRQIVLSRQGQEPQTLDLYQILLTGKREVDVALQDGDRLLVPPLGDTLAVVGPVRRPGIYELAAKSPEIGLEQALFLAGESRLPQGVRFMQETVSNSGANQVASISVGSGKVLGDQNIVRVASNHGGERGAVEVVGTVNAPGKHAIDRTTTLAALLGDDPSSLDNVYPLFGVIERTETTTRAKEYIPFKPAAVIQGEGGAQLQEGDKVRLFSNQEARGLLTNGDNPNRDTNIAADAATSNAMVAAGKTAGLQTAALTKDINADKLSFFKPTSVNIPGGENNTNPVARLAEAQSVAVRGAVLQPGVYPVAANTSLSDILAAAGGVATNAESEVEIIQSKENSLGLPRADRQVINLKHDNPKLIKVAAGAAVRINPRGSAVQRDAVFIDGEVKRPGYYDVMRGEKLSSLLQRAGGLTDEAYPTGSVFTRQAAKQREAEMYQKTASDLEVALSHAVGQTEPMPDGTSTGQRLQTGQVQAMIDRLRSAAAVGRVTIESDPSVLSREPQLDTLLEPGDRLYIPPRRNTVNVVGEVFSPASLQFTDKKDTADYLKEAGGFTRFADQSKAFVVMPNGAAQPIQVSSWNHEPLVVPPGATVVVPRDPEYIDTLKLTTSIGNILTQLAVSSAALASINDNHRY